MEHISQTPPSPEATVGQGLSIRRYFTTPETHPFDAVEWELRDARIGHGDKVSFEQSDVEFPKRWSQNATNIVAQKYFRGQLGSPARERSVKQMIGRVARTITSWGRERGYFVSDEDAAAFEAELTHILLHQMAAFNSPVWFNVGFEETPQCSACFILSVEDNMESILDWNTKEGKIFRGGSGSGINLSKIRGSMEPLAKGGTASGPVSFMRGADAWAGTIKSGGKTRRAAKMVVLDVDHPDIREFIWCKAKEEDKAAALRDAGFDMSIDGDGFFSIQYQNANNSVRLTDEFMHAVENDEDWQLIARITGEPIGEPIPARQLMQEIAEAAWRCADPGIQYDSTINQWHTCPASGRINASNPCSEYMHVDDSACNLASLNLMKFRRADGTLDVEGFKHAVDIMFLAQEIIVSPSSYPTEQIGENARSFRQLGLGYANLGAYLMADGVPYDSDAGRGTAAAITALMTGRAYLGSARVAAALGPYDRYQENREPHNAVMRMHRDASYAIPDSTCADTELLSAARSTWEAAVDGRRGARLPQRPGDGARAHRHDQLPDGLRHHRRRARLLAGQVQGARRRRADDDRQPDRAAGAADTRVHRGADRADRRLRQRAEHDRRRAGPGRRTPAGVRRGGRRARDLAHGPFEDDGRGAAVHQRRDLEDREHARDRDRRGHRRRLHPGVASRDQGARDLPRRLQDRAGAAHRRPEGRSRRPADAQAEIEKAVTEALAKAPPKRRKMPRERQSITHKFSIGGHEGYITAGMYEDGTVGEIFLTDIGKEGSTLRGMMNSFATAISIALQYGVPLETLVRKFSYMRFEPEGMTSNPEIPFAKSMPDYIMRWLASRFLDTDLQEELGILTRRSAPGRRRRTRRARTRRHRRAGRAQRRRAEGRARRQWATATASDTAGAGAPRRPRPR